MVGNKVAYFATVHFLIFCSFWSHLFSNFTAFQRLHFFFFSLRIMKHTITPYNVYNVLWDVVLAVSDS